MPTYSGQESASREIVRSADSVFRRRIRSAISSSYENSGRSSYAAAMASRSSANDSSLSFIGPSTSKAKPALGQGFENFVEDSEGGVHTCLLEAFLRFDPQPVIARSVEES